ncbi:lysozyme inhibitor LprI family protein [uncultured Clostridium sp.]|uniref:lysozyme inhibitor LprI family protein n=1 Tax=uncultured Clostridium sp. TaxID=59620 RepID=UPI0025CD288E|nr:lysozyme inhibitor LprI family protein [uncultured Clostridium sp.]
MKNRGVIIAIILILIMGAGVTVGTRRFIHDKTSDGVASNFQGQIPPSEELNMESMAMAAAGMTSLPESGGQEAGLDTGDTRSRETAKEQAPAEAGSETGEQKAAGRMPDAAAGSGSVSTYSDSEGTASAKEEAAAVSADTDALAAAPAAENAPAAKSSVVISPLTGVSESDTAVTEYVTTLDGYRKKLNEIDGLIQNMQGSEASSNTDSLKKVADYEYYLWDTELNHIYQAILEGMTEEEAQDLKTEERAWIRSRDLAAKKAASKFGGGTMESLEYTASLSDSTRTRAYELLEQYGTYITEGKD